MAHIGLKLHEVQAWGGESDSLPPGPYAFEIADVKQENSSKKGTLMLNIECKVIAPSSLQDRKIFHRLVIDPNAKDGSRKRLRSLTDATLIELDAEGGFDDQELIGRGFIADVFVESYKDIDPVTMHETVKESSRIKNERPYTEEGLAEIEGGEAPLEAAAEPEPEPEPAPAPAPARPAVAARPAAAAVAARPAAAAARPAAAAAARPTANGAAQPAPRLARPAPLQRA